MKNNMQRVIGNLVILTPVIVGLVFYNRLPSRVAIHFNVEEQANGFMDRNLAIVVLPFIALVIYNLLFSFFKQITIHPRSHIDFCFRRPNSSSIDCHLVSGTHFSSNRELSS